MRRSAGHPLSEPEGRSPLAVPACDPGSDDDRACDGLEHIARTKRLVQEFRREVGTVGPHDGSQFGIQHDFCEPRFVLQRLEHVAPEFGFQIDLDDLEG